MGLESVLIGSFAVYSSDRKTKLWGGGGRKRPKVEDVAVIAKSYMQAKQLGHKKTHTQKGGSTHVSQQRCQTDPQE